MYNINLDVFNHFSKHFKGKTIEKISKLKAISMFNMLNIYRLLKYYLRETLIK